MSAADDRPPSLDHGERPDVHRLREAAGLLALMGEPTRLELLWLLSERALTVGELDEQVAASRTAVSQHLAKLRLAGVVHATREGRQQRYDLTGGHVRRLVREALNQADHAVTGEAPHR